MDYSSDTSGMSDSSVDEMRVDADAGGMACQSGSLCGTHADLCSSILESMHVRVKRLEDVWKAGFHVRDARQPFVLTLSSQNNPPSWGPINKLFPALMGAGRNPMGDIWVNPKSGLGKVTKVEIQKEIMTRDKSNGIPCLLIVCLAKINDVEVVLKFRQVDAMSGDSTEKEASNTLKVSFDSNLDGMFPKLYCILKVITSAPGDVRREWECIGTQKLAELSKEDKVDPFVLQQCAGLLRSLHSFGYIHGDPHLGNYMKTSDSGLAKVYMIDQDEVRSLPNNNRAISNYLQISDYRTLMFSGNPICDAYSRMGMAYQADPERFRYYSESVTIGVFKKLGYFSVVFAPVMFYSYRGSEFKVIESVLTSSQATLSGVPYLHFLGSGDVDSNYIDRKFAGVFADINMMIGANRQLLDEWQSQAIAHGEVTRV